MLQRTSYSIPSRVSLRMLSSTVAATEEIRHPMSSNKCGAATTATEVMTPEFLLTWCSNGAATEAAVPFQIGSCGVGVAVTFIDPRAGGADRGDV
jgi:hypothetical protein